MIPCWSTSKYCLNYKDPYPVCLVTSIDGKCALVSRRAISLTKVNDVRTIATTIKRDTKWDTQYAEFSNLKKDYMAVTNAQTVQIFDVNQTDNPNGVYILKGHTRNVTDLNWSTNDENLLASVSPDNYVHIYDIRDIKRPVQSMHSISGATHVKWAKKIDQVFATSHEGDVRIWDKRKSNTPIHYISAHIQKINAIDWNLDPPTQFVTCSHDGSIKVWDINSPKSKPVYTLSTCLPVWRARFTPFPRGLMTALVPQLRRTGENNSLWMWDVENLEKPMHSFAGHLDVVLDFGWWHYAEANKFGLITWAKDNIVRQWDVTADVLFDMPTPPVVVNGRGPFDDQLIYEEDTQEATELLEAAIEESPSSNGDGMAEIRKNMIESSDSLGEGKSESMAADAIFINGSANSEKKDKFLTLQQEFSLVNRNIQGLSIEEMSPAKRMCEVVIRGKFSCRMKILFPNNYPFNVIPHFMIINESVAPESGGSNGEAARPLTDMMKRELLKVLQTTAAHQVQRHRACLEKCLRNFMQKLEKLTAEHNGEARRITILDLLPAHKYGSYLDASVPFPRTSGARFCSGHLLVCFGRPPHLEQMNVPTEFTPRSLSALSAYLTTHVRALDRLTTAKDNLPSISLAYLDQTSAVEKRKTRRAQRRQQQQQQQQQQVVESPEHTSSPPPLCGPVACFNVNRLLPISRELAEHYWITSKDVIGLCEKNAKIALTLNREDLYATWLLVRHSAEIYLKNYYLDDCFLTSWATHPLGRNMINSMISYYALKLNDIQMAAMIATTFIQFNEQLMDVRSHRQNYPFINEKANLLPQIRQKKSKVNEEKLRELMRLNNLCLSEDEDGEEEEKKGEDSEDDDEDEEEEEDSEEETSAAGGVASADRSDSAPPPSLPGSGNRGGHRVSECSTTMQPSSQPLQQPPQPSPSPPLPSLTVIAGPSSLEAQQTTGQTGDSSETSAGSHAGKTDKDERNEIFDAESMAVYNTYCKIYADILYRWRLMNQRAQLFKTVQPKSSTVPTPGELGSKASFIPLLTECRTPKCRQRQILCSTSVCRECNKVSLTCVICRLPVKGLTNHCFKCGHGGHALHMQEWFGSNDECPTGCGCICITRRRKSSDEESKPQPQQATTSTSANNSEHRVKHISGDKTINGK